MTILILAPRFSFLASSATWIPFVTPAPLWDYWWILLFPLLAGVAVVYKSIKCRRMGRVFVEAAQLWVYTVVAMALGAAALTVLVRLVLG